MSVLDDEKFKHPSGSYEAVARVPTPCWVRLAAYTQDPVLPRQPVPVPVAMIPSWSPNYSQCTGAKHWQVEAQRAALLCTKVYVSSSLGVRCLLCAHAVCGCDGLDRRRAVSVYTEMSGVRRVSTFNRIRERVCIPPEECVSRWDYCGTTRRCGCRDGTGALCLHLHSIYSCYLLQCAVSHPHFNRDLSRYWSVNSSLIECRSSAPPPPNRSESVRLGRYPGTHLSDSQGHKLETFTEASRHPRRAALPTRTPSKTPTNANSIYNPSCNVHDPASARPLSPHAATRPWVAHDTVWPWPVGPEAQPRS